jgi:predicted ATP-dependent protease
MIQVKELRNKTNDVLLKKELDCQIAMLQQQHEKMAKKTTFKRRKALKIQKQLIQFRNIRNEIGELLREESREGPQEALMNYCHNTQKRLARSRRLNIKIPFDSRKAPWPITPRKSYKKKA